MPPDDDRDSERSDIGSLVRHDLEAPIDVRREPPVVARLVVEIRSDGTHTIARGAAEDVTLGEKVAVEFKGGSPLQLALSIVKSLGAIPALARTFRAAMIPKKPDRSPKNDDR